MTYDPQYLSNLVPPIATTGAYTLCATNHNEVFESFEPPVATWAGEPFFTTSFADEDMLRFRSRNGADFAVGGVGLRLQVKVVAKRNVSGAGPGTLNLKGGVPMVTVTVTSTTFAVHTLTANPATTDEEWTLSAVAAPTDTIEVAAMTAYWVASAPGTRFYPSGFRGVGSFVVQSNRPVSSELVARLMNGPITIAKDRPACVFSHLFRASTDKGSFAKLGDVDYSAWGAEALTERTVCGHGRIPVTDVRTRPYIVTYYLRTSSGTGGTIRVGGASFTVTPDSWQSFQLDLGPAETPIVAMLDPMSAGEWAYFESVQVWRQAA